MLRFSTKEAFLQKVLEQTGCPPPRCPQERMYRSGGGAACVPPPLETGVGVAQYPHFPSKGLRSPPRPPASVHSCASACTPIMSECVFTSSLARGSPLPALQVGIVLLPLKARAPSEKSAASALPFSPKCQLWMWEGGARPCCSWAPLPRCLLLGRLRGSWQGQGPGGRFRKRVQKAGRPDCCLPEEWL